MRSLAETTPTAGYGRALSLRKNFAWTVSGNIIYSACQWGILVAIAKQGTPAMVGQFALGTAITAPAFMFTNLHLRAVQATDARRGHDFGHYLALRLVGTSIALAAVLAFTMLGGYHRDTALVILGVALAKAAESISDIVYGLWQARERLDKISTAMIGRGVTSLLTLVAVLHATHSLVWAVLALATVWVVWLLTYERSVAGRMLAVESKLFDPKWQFGHLMSLARLAAPLGVVMLLLSLNANIPRYLLQRCHGEAALGYLAAIAYLVVASSTVMNALGQSAAPRFARSYVTDRQAFVLLLSKMVWIAAALGIGGVLVVVIWGNQILSLVYRPDYGDHADVFLLLVIAGGTDLLSSALGFAFTATRRFASYLVPYTFNTAAGFAMGLLLIPTLGLRGAAFAGLEVSLSQLLAVALLLRRALTVPPSLSGETVAGAP